MTAAPPPAAPRIVRYVPAANLVWATYDDSDEWVVYHPASGDVHLLSASAHRLWTLVADDHIDAVEDLVAALAADIGRPVDAELTGAAVSALDFMDRAGLLIPVFA
jgi:PqqD family protein of HPr-rel-A system